MGMMERATCTSGAWTGMNCPARNVARTTFISGLTNGPSRRFAPIRSSFLAGRLATVPLGLLLSSYVLIRYRLPALIEAGAIESVGRVRERDISSGYRAT